MKYNDLRRKVLDYPIFTFEDVAKYFPHENQVTFKAQLSRWVKRGYLKKIKRGLFVLEEMKLEDDFSLAPIIYSPSYISLESALNVYGIIPDIPFVVTSATLKKTKIFKTPFGSFNYRHLKEALFWGFKIEGERPFLYKIAYPEKALLDYLYLNPEMTNYSSFPQDYRFNLRDLDWLRMKSYVRIFKNKRLKKAAKDLKDFYMAERKEANA